MARQIENRAIFFFVSFIKSRNIRPGNCRQFFRSKSKEDRLRLLFLINDTLSGKSGKLCILMQDGWKVTAKQLIHCRSGKSRCSLYQHHVDIVHCVKCSLFDIYVHNTEIPRFTSLMRSSETARLAKIRKTKINSREEAPGTTIGLREEGARKAKIGS
jgi:hypothetical protein